MPDRSRRQGWRARWLAAALVFLYSVPLSAADPTGTAAPAGSLCPQAPSCSYATGPAATPPEVVLVSTDEPWLMALLTPAIATLRHNDARPLLIAAEAPLGGEVKSLVEAVAPQRCLIVLPAADSPPPDDLPGDPRLDVLRTTCSPLEASLIVARRFWGRSRRVIAAPAGDPEAAILGSTLAAHLALPLVLCEDEKLERLLQDVARELAAEKVFLSAGTSSGLPSRMGASRVEVSTLDPRDLQAEVIAALGAASVRNVILTRAPERESGAGSTAWLAPYLGLARRSPVVLVHDEDAAQAGAAVDRLIEDYRLNPDTVTIVADYPSIGRNKVTIPLDSQTQETQAVGDWYEDGFDYAEETSYEVATEPCMPTSSQQVATVGVGRLPFASLEKSSMMVARGLARERLLAARPGRLLMVANPNPRDRALPLCETVSRTTAGEFRNAGVLVHEFYGTPSNGPETRQAAAGAQLIVYEGHLYDQRLFSETSEFEEGDEYYDYEEDSEFYDAHPGHEAEWPEGESDNVHPEYEAEWPDGDQPAAEFEHFTRAAAVDMTGQQPAVTGGRLAYPDLDLPPRAQARLEEMGPPPIQWTRPFSLVSLAMRAEEAAKPAADAGAPPRLDGLPVVILQTCDSLEPTALRRIHALGGVALVGSVTHIHSASGSSFVKAVCDGVLYRAGTLGEAMRDAQNYFFCLQDLKDRRGHSQQTKSRRAAMSFQLWGDPQLRVFPHPVDEPRIVPVSAQWRRRDELNVSVPADRLETSRTEKYFLRMFPGSQTAGLVKRLKNKPVRRVTPVYFFRLPLPESFAASEFSSLSRPGDGPNRAVFRVDPMERFLYVLYYPDKEEPSEDITLRFHQ